jgi:hypothetical protein
LSYVTVYENGVISFTYHVTDNGFKNVMFTPFANELKSEYAFYRFLKQHNVSR